MTNALWDNLGTTSPPVGPATPAINDVPIWNGAQWTPGKVQSASITDGTIVNADVNASAAIAGSKVAYSRGASPPGSPADGDLWEAVVDATNDVHWLFRWKSSSSRWVFLGGPPLFAEVVTSESTTSTSYAALTTAGPSIAVPRAGDYDVEVGFTNLNSTANTNEATMSYDIGATGAVDADSVKTTSKNTNESFAASRPRRKTGLTAVTLTAKYKVAVATAQNFSNRWMRVTPVRVP